MNEETFNLSIRKFLKLVGVSSQREIEQAVAKAVASGAASGTETFPAGDAERPAEPQKSTSMARFG
jgi:hypothetical protein